MFDLEPLMFSLNEAKSALIFNFLSDWVAHCATAVIESHAPTVASYDMFVAELQVFDLSVQGSEALTKFFSFCQGSSSVADYAVQFCIYVKYICKPWLEWCGTTRGILHNIILTLWVS